MSSTEKDVSGSVEDTVTALKKQIEFYFSRENLATDTYLASIMRDRYAPVSKIAEFKKVKSLTTDLDVLLQAMRTSDAVVLSEDETQVKPAFELRRNTIMLREIPRETPEADVRAIFDDPGAAEVKRIRAEMNDNWYVQFEDEDVTLSTFMWLQSQTFNGKPIKARVKTESLLLSGPPAPVQGSGGSPAGGAGAGAPFSGGVASGPGAPFVAGSHNPYAYMGYVPPQYMPVVAQGGYGYNPYMQQPPAQGLMNGAPGSGQAPYYPNAAPYAHSGTDHTYGGRRGGRGGNGGSGPGNANNGNRKSGPRNSGKGDGNKGKDGSSPVLKEYESAESGPNGSGARGGRRGGDSKRGGSGGRRAGGNNDGDSRRGNRNGDRNGKGGKGGNRGGRGKGNNANGAAPANAKNSPRKQQAPDFELGLNSFPPLPAAKGTDPKPTGYDQEFVSYSRESLVGIIRSFADAALSKPEELASSAAPVVLDAPDVSLEVEKPVPEIKRRKKNARNRRRGNDNASSRNARKSSDRIAAVGERRRASAGAAGANKKTQKSETAASTDTTTTSTTTPSTSAPPASSDAPTPAATATASPASDAAPAAAASPASGTPPPSSSAKSSDSPSSPSKKAPESTGKPTYADLFKKS